MSKAGYIGTQAGSHHKWLIPYAFRARWIAMGNRVIRAHRESDGPMTPKPTVIRKRKVAKVIGEVTPPPLPEKKTRRRRVVRAADSG